MLRVQRGVFTAVSHILQSKMLTGEAAAGVVFE